jgi:hypothetical protein
MEECGTLRFDIAARIVEELRRYTDTPPGRENTIHILDGAEQMVAELKQIETDLHRTARRKTTEETHSDGPKRMAETV